MAHVSNRREMASSRTTRTYDIFPNLVIKIQKHDQEHDTLCFNISYLVFTENTNFY